MAGAGDREWLAEILARIKRLEGALDGIAVVLPVLMHELEELRSALERLNDDG